ncbi:MAG: competence/damage-inducible protein A [Firmicutes bacterium]|nr:competence/damage-inducible protein A [Bacillota bacterium]
MSADLICIGNEILTGLVENSNSGFISRRLWSMGIDVRESVVVADEEPAIRDALDRALSKTDLVIITGGLGPTDDDLTREAVAGIIDKQLILDRTWLYKMERFFKLRGINMTDNNIKQAMVIDGGKMLENTRGTAPGMIVDYEGKLIVMLPGPPNEMQYMFDNAVVPVLVEQNYCNLSMVKTLKCIGMGESMLEEKIKSIGVWEFPPISYVARGYEVYLQIKGYGNRKEAELLIEEAERRLRDALGDYIFGADDETLAGVVAYKLTSRGKTLALAESCSGGLLSDVLTDIPGSSKFYLGGIVAYSRFAKTKLLGIDPALIEKEGEVSEATAKAMAKGARSRFKSDLGVGITGIAGPQSDSSKSRVGLVYIAIEGDSGLNCRELNLGGGRRVIKERSAQAALDMLRKFLLDT